MTIITRLVRKEYNRLAEPIQKTPQSAGIRWILQISVLIIMIIFLGGLAIAIAQGNQPRSPATIWHASTPFQQANIIECGWWWTSALLVALAFRTETRVFRESFLMSLVLIAFGCSDLIESGTGAWWRPWWLFAMKAGCVAGIVGLIARIVFVRKRRDETTEQSEFLNHQ
jgi:hypothetical protein